MIMLHLITSIVTTPTAFEANGESSFSAEEIGGLARGIAGGCTVIAGILTL